MSVHTNTYQYMQYIPNTIHTKTYHANTYQYISQYKPQYILIHTMKSNTCQYTHITSLMREPQGGREREEGREGQVREGGRERERDRGGEGGWEGGREGGREGESEGAREQGREGAREGGNKQGSEGGREGAAKATSSRHIRLQLAKICRNWRNIP